MDRLLDALHAASPAEQRAVLSQLDARLPSVELQCSSAARPAADDARDAMGALLDEDLITAAELAATILRAAHHRARTSNEAESVARVVARLTVRDSSLTELAETALADGPAI